MKPFEIPYWYVRSITYFDESIHDTCDLVQKTIRTLFLCSIAFMAGAGYGFMCYMGTASFPLNPVINIGLGILLVFSPLIALIVVAAIREGFDYLIQRKVYNQNEKHSKIHTLWKSLTGKLCVPVRIVRKDENYNDQEG